MKNIVLFFALIITTIVFAQNDETFVDSLVAQKMAELELQQNPEYFFRKDYCVGNIQLFNLPDGSLCASRSTYYSVYLFWKEDDEVLKLQKFDNCGSFMPLKIVRNKTLIKLLNEEQALKSETVKKYEGEKVDDNAFGNMSVQSCHKEYKFVFEGKAFEKSFREFDLTNDSKYRNVNADHNNSLKLIKLDNEVSELLKNLEKNGKFFRED
ncbi:hypothetical protein [Aequorivita lipolytica]|uniref:Uncharacterized protein n=1 Tax=Aequorivita lipolytica TaxID=153267 RepID=A0A5C6YMM6_9FLAO|nr:hypothetical protein [Aequorivita lipolytica]TXD68512.1 hypothetical protein ESV24_11400 [Aequorivita lipolytica]SRX53346.1 hypothetical protein AEQU2_02576 [Aequorivita lipolytica]